MANGIFNGRLSTTAMLLPSTAAPDVTFGPIGEIDINSNRFLHAFGTNNTFIGSLSGNYTLTVVSAIDSTGVGYNTLNSLTTGANNTAIGEQSCNAVTTSSANTGVGAGTLGSLTTGNGKNTALGFASLENLLTGVGNTCIGFNSGINYVGAEVGNILINNIGLAAESNITRIGTQGTQLGCFIAGITGVTPSNPQTVGINSVTGQLGIIAGAGPAIETITGNTGGALGPTAGNFNFLTANSTVKFAGAGSTETVDFGITNLVLGSALPSLAGGTGNIGLGNNVLNAITSGINNIAIGAGIIGGTEAGKSLTSGANNIAIGVSALYQATTAYSNIAIGYSALTSVVITAHDNICIGDVVGSALTTGTNNCIIGSSGAAGLISGSFNTAIGGNGPGAAWTGAESSNIAIGSAGVIGESNTIRIGNPGGGNNQQSACYIVGIDGVNVGSVAKVVTEASNQLGTATIASGTGVNVVPTANTITINAVGGGVTWSVITINQTAAVNNGYFCNKAGTLALALPAVSAVGDVIEAANINTALGVQFTQAAGQQIFFSTTSTTLGATGTLTSTALGDTIKLVCRAANTTWQAVAGIGNWTPA